MRIPFLAAKVKIKGLYGNFHRSDIDVPLNAKMEFASTFGNNVRDYLDKSMRLIKTISE